MEPGESAAEACAREVLEETGLQVRVRNLLGVYSTPHRLLEYPDGNRVQIVDLCFSAEMVGGELRLSEETTEFGFFTLEEVSNMDVTEPTRERLNDCSMIFGDR